MSILRESIGTTVLRKGNGNSTRGIYPPGPHNAVYPCPCRRNYHAMIIHTVLLKKKGSLCTPCIPFRCNVRAQDLLCVLNQCFDYDCDAGVSVLLMMEALDSLLITGASVSLLATRASVSLSTMGAFASKSAVGASGSLLVVGAFPSFLIRSDTLPNISGTLPMIGRVEVEGRRILTFRSDSSEILASSLTNDWPHHAL